MTWEVCMKSRTVHRARLADSLALAPLHEVRDEVLSGAECLYDPYLHTGPDVFEHEPRAERLAREAVAKDVCAGCTVTGSCLEYALRIRPASGVWAGLTAAEVTVLADLTEAAQPAVPGADREVA
jgi:WhiB family transcriptional regulator, redox-sensing transcriptional regulator